jgi:hypothetical protein
VIKKLAELMREEFKTNKIAIKPISTLPIAVKRVLDENGVIIAHPGKRSLALRSKDQNTLSSLR